MTKFERADLVEGDTILERLGAAKLPVELRAPHAAFSKVHRAMRDGQAAVEAALDDRDQAVRTVQQTDTKLDRALESLASLLALHGLGSRKNPFANFSTMSPSEVEGLAYAKEAAEAVRIATAVKKTKPHKDVVAACDAVIAAARAVPVAIRGVAGPQRVYAAALGKRDALLPEWTVARTRLERKAIGAWADEPEMVRAFFAPPSAMERPVTKRAKKKDAPPAADGKG